ncbi:hypothetical protein B296_00015027 [Ensete ventricosum]|uniref:Uncharacterized protein n=1 Tax=Ensete ventricosum TaxID=4639 RepID=A0A427AC00_ENSVE|nr:hypothetical protein B296_00015027 [Ensete ventricosum]
MSNDSFYHHLPVIVLLFHRLPLPRRTHHCQLPHSSPAASTIIDFLIPLPRHPSTQGSLPRAPPLSQAPAGSGTFPTPSVADDGFYTCFNLLHLISTSSCYRRPHLPLQPRQPLSPNPMVLCQHLVECSSSSPAPTTTIVTHVSWTQVRSRGALVIATRIDEGVFYCREQRPPALAKESNRGDPPREAMVLQDLLR